MLCYVVLTETIGKLNIYTHSFSFSDWSIVLVSYHGDKGSLDASYNNMNNTVVNPWDLLSIRYLVSKLTLSNEQKRRFLFSLSRSAYREQHIIHSNCLKGLSRIVEPEPPASDFSANAAQRFAGKSQQDRAVPHTDFKALPHMRSWRTTNPPDRIFQAAIHSHTIK